MCANTFNASYMSFIDSADLLVVREQLQQLLSSTSSILHPPQLQICDVDACKGQSIEAIQAAQRSLHAPGHLLPPTVLQVLRLVHTCMHIVVHCRRSAQGTCDGRRHGICMLAFIPLVLWAVR